MSAYDIFLSLHNLLRWVVLLGGLAAAGRALYGWLSNAGWTSLDNQLGLLFTVSFDLQFLLGLVLYFVLSPITTGNFTRFGEAMGQSEIRFYLVEHLLAMIVALGLAHAGRTISKRAEAPQKKHQRAAAFFTVAILIVMAMIPWARPLFRI